MMRMDRVRRAEVGAYVVAAAGAGALVAFGLYSSYGQPLGTLNDILLLVFGLGLLHGGATDPLTFAGGIGYQILFPVWAFLFARLLGTGDRRA